MNLQKLVVWYRDRKLPLNTMALRRVLDGRSKRFVGIFSVDIQKLAKRKDPLILMLFKSGDKWIIQYGDSLGQFLVRKQAYIVGLLNAAEAARCPVCVVLADRPKFLDPLD